MSPRTLAALLSSAALAAVALVAAPPPATAAGIPLTINATERGSGEPVPGACYYVVDVIKGGSLVGGCDDGQGGDAVRHDGEVVLVLTNGGECDQCEVVQTLPNLAPGVPTNHLLASSQTGGWHDYQFQNYLKPYLQIGFVDDRTGVQLPGACIGISETGFSGGIYAGCDGNPSGGNSDRDGLGNGVIETGRFAIRDWPENAMGTFTVGQSRSGVPKGYLPAESFDVVAPPAETGDVVTRTVELVGDATVLVRTVNKKGRLLKGACYAVKDTTLGAGLGRICDGAAGDDDGSVNGRIRLGQLPATHTYLVDQKSAPRGYRLFKRNKTVTTSAGEESVVKVVNRKR